jgi:hypothetical protein
LVVKPEYLAPDRELGHDTLRLGTHRRMRKSSTSESTTSTARPTTR